MAALGVGWATRKIGAKMGRTITFKATGDGSFHVISESTLKTNERDVKLNEEFEGERDDKAVLGNQIRYSTRSSVSDLIWSDQISVFEVLIRFQSENFIFFSKTIRSDRIRSDIKKAENSVLSDLVRSESGHERCLMPNPAIK